MSITPEIHIGRAIESRLNQMNITAADFARLLNTSRQNVNRILKKESIETSVLRKYCDVLDYNFFSMYCQEKEIYEASGSHAILAKNIEKIDNREMVDIKETNDEQTKIIFDDASEEDEISSSISLDSYKHKIEKLTLEVNLLKDHLETTKNQLADKERFIAHLLNSKQ